MCGSLGLRGRLPIWHSPRGRQSCSQGMEASGYNLCAHLQPCPSSPVSSSKRLTPLSGPQVTWSNSCTRVPGPDCWRQSKPCIREGAQDHRDSRSPCRACGGRPSALCGGGEGRGAQDHSRVQSRTVTQSWWRQAICPLGERGREGSQASGRPLRLSQAEEETAV